MSVTSDISFWDPVNISESPSAESIHGDVLAINEHVYVAWMDGEVYPTYDIYLKASHDYGKSFGPAIKLSDGGFNLLPKIAAFGSDVYVLWLHEGDGDFGAKFRSSHDNGTTFDPRIDFGADTWYARSDIAAYDNNVYLVFEHPANPGTEMIFLASHDNGVTFDKPFIYRDGPCVAAEPHVAAWENHVYVTAQDPCEDHPDLLFRASHDNGTTFSDPTYLGDGSQQVVILAKEEFVYVVWNENTADVNFRVSKDNGSTFSSIKTLEGDLDVANPIPRMAITGSNDVYVMWQSNIFPQVTNATSRSEEDEINEIKTHLFFTASYDNGQNFNPLIQFDSTEDYSVDPQLAASGKNVFVVWQNTSAFWIPSGGQVFLKWSDDKGQSFSDTIVIDDDTGNSVGSARPLLETAGKRAYVSWWQSDELDTPPDVFIQKITLEDAICGAVLNNSGTIRGNAIVEVPCSPCENDNLEPLVSITSLLDVEANERTSGVATFRIAGTASDSGDGCGVEIVEVKVKDPITFTLIKKYEAAIPAATDYWSTWTHEITFDREGDYSIVARATDKAGNKNWFWSTFKLEFDAEADETRPTVKITSPDTSVAITGPSSGVALDLAGTAFDAGRGVARVEVKINDPDTLELISGYKLATATGPDAQDDYSTWEKQLTFDQEGTYRVTARATDESGNRNWSHILVKVEFTD